MYDVAWKVELAEAVMDLRMRGEAISLLSLLSRLRTRENGNRDTKPAADRAIKMLLNEYDMGEVGDLSDAF